MGFKKKLNTPHIVDLGLQRAIGPTHASAKTLEKIYMHNLGMKYIHWAAHSHCSAQVSKYGWSGVFVEHNASARISPCGQSMLLGAN